MNPDLQGRSFPPSAPYLVGREKVREFARAVLATDPVSFDVEAARAAGHADLVAPPTFPVVVQQLTLDQLLADPDAGIDFSRVVHGEQRFVHHRPLTAGDAIVGTLHVDTVREAGGHAMVTTRTELATEAGEPVCTATSTIVIRGAE